MPWLIEPSGNAFDKSRSYRGEFRPLTIVRAEIRVIDTIDVVDGPMIVICGGIYRESKLSTKIVAHRSEDITDHSQLFPW